MSGEVSDNDLNVGAWEHTIGMDTGIYEDGVNIFDEGWRHFWSQTEVEAFVYDNEGKIIEAKRTEKPRVMPKTKSWASNPW